MPLLSLGLCVMHLTLLFSSPQSIQHHVQVACQDSGIGAFTQAEPGHWMGAPPAHVGLMATYQYCCRSHVTHLTPCPWSAGMHPIPFHGILATHGLWQACTGKKGVINDLSYPTPLQLPLNGLRLHQGHTPWQGMGMVARAYWCGNGVPTLLAMLPHILCSHADTPGHSLLAPFAPWSPHHRAMAA